MKLRWLGRLTRGFAVARRLAPHLVGRRTGMVLAGVLSLVAAALVVMRPWPLKWIFDGALAPRDPAAPSPYGEPGTVVLLSAAALLVIIVARLWAEYFASVKLAEVGQGVTRSLRLALFRHLSELSPEFHSDHKSGDLLVRLMGDVPMVRTMLVDSFVMIITRVVLVIGTVGVMLWLDALLTLVVLAALPILVLCIRLLSRSITVAVRKQRAKDGALADFLQEALVATDVIQSLGGTDHTVRRFARGNRSSVRAGLKAARASARLSAWVEAILGLSTAATLVLGSLRVIDGHMTPGDLLVFLAYVRSLSKPARSSAKHMDKVAKGTACGERILEILERDETMRTKSGTDPAPAHPARIDFLDVTYRYKPTSEPALEGVSFRLERGKLTALFGPSGAGKSTITKLALRLFDPQEGRVLVDGRPLTELDIDDLRSRFALAMQETVLFGDTVRENLLLAAPDASDEEIETALRSAGAGTFVDELPDGLDTVLGASGKGFSGGQRRRLCLARALLRDAPILVVDEPFSGLDEPTARCVERTLAEAASRSIVLVITHAVARLPRFDRVVFLERGRMVDAGTHADLMARCPRYSAICSLLEEPVS